MRRSARASPGPRCCAPSPRGAAPQPSPPYPGAGRIAAMTDEELRARFAGTALLRSKPAGLRRNATIAGENAARDSGVGARGRWPPKREFLAGLALSKMLRGPPSPQRGVLISHARGGLRGAL